MWTFGSLGSGFYATITFDGTNFKVTCVEGAFDLNALWFSDGDNISGEGGATLPKGDSSLSMNGTKAKWDDYAKLSSPGLKTGQTSGGKDTYFTVGKTQTYSLSSLFSKGLSSSWINSISDWSTITLGIRATSVSGVAGTSSIKYVSTPSTPDLIAPTVTAGQSFSYAENQSANAIIGTVAATDNVAVTGFRFANPGGTAGTTSSDGYYTIDNSGSIRITAAGVAAGVAQNDFETTPNAFIYGIQARDAAGNWSAAADITLNVSDERPLVVAGQAFGYTENRHPNSFIGSVDASDETDETRVTGYGFWDSDKNSADEFSPDGLFRIDNRGRIWLTAAGAASFANNFEDTEADGSPVNIHTVSVVATNGNGTWSLPTLVTLSETNCKCDDPDLDYLIDLTSPTDIKKTLFGPDIYDIEYNYSPTFPDGENPSGVVEAGKELIRMTASGPSAPWAELSLVSIGEANQFADVACVNVQADGRATVTFVLSNKLVDGQVVNSDYFMSALEKIYVANPGYTGPFQGASLVTIDSDGGYQVMPNLKDITLKCMGDDSAFLTVYGDVNSYEEYTYDPFSVTVYHPNELAGDDFMRSLETIHLSSVSDMGRSEANIRSLGGDNFMGRLGSIDMQANGRANLTLEAYRKQQSNSDYEVIGYNGNNEDFMSALEVINLMSNGSTTNSDLRLKIEAKESDNFLSSVSLIDTNWSDEGNFRFYNRGGSAFMGSLKEVSTGAPPNRRTDFELINERYVDDLNVTHEASDFMTTLESISILNTQQINKFEIRNGNYDFASPVYSVVNGGSNFLPSLRSIELDASNGIGSGSGSINFKLIVDQQDPATLSSLESLIINGSEIRAEFAGITGNEAWFDVDQITGIADGQQDDFFFDLSLADGIVVRAGFDTETVEDRIFFDSFTGITSLADLVITPLGTDSVRIGFAASLGYDGAVIVTGVPYFDPTVNIGFG